MSGISVDFFDDVMILDETYSPVSRFLFLFLFFFNLARMRRDNGQNDTQRIVLRRGGLYTNSGPYLLLHSHFFLTHIELILFEIL
jgi:hypothetical protein